MNCNECRELISDYVDGEMGLGAQTKIENHLADCEPCRAVRDDLLQIVHFSRQLPLHTPSSTVWARIQEQIDEEQPKTTGARLKTWWGKVQGRDFHLSIPQFATVTAAVIVMVVVGAIIFRNTQTSNLQIGPGAAGPTVLLYNPDFEQIEKRINELKGTVEQRKAAWSPELRDSFEKSMIYVDQSLADCRKELNNNPEDETCRELLSSAYKEKMRVLEGFGNF
jgi:anti-sigma-K factor RskA